MNPFLRISDNEWVVRARIERVSAEIDDGEVQEATLHLIGTGGDSLEVGPKWAPRVLAELELEWNQ